MPQSPHAGSPIQTLQFLGLAFAAWTAMTFVVAGQAQGILVSFLAFIMAVLVAQTRVETGIHSLLEVILGALLGIGVTTVIFQFWF